MSTETGETVELKGPNRDEGKLISFAIKGDLTYRILRHVETGDQALILTLPRHVAAQMAYRLVAEIEAEDIEEANTRLKEKTE